MMIKKQFIKSEAGKKGKKIKFTPKPIFILPPYPFIDFISGVI